MAHISGENAIRNAVHLGGFPQFRATGIHKWTRAIAALTGTFLTTPTEAEVVTGGQTIIITLSEGKWVKAGTLFDAQRQAIINGLDSAQAEAGGWNATVRDVMAVTTVVRTSDTVVTITLPATAGYLITANETITVTIPNDALEGLPDADITATPTIVIVNA